MSTYYNEIDPYAAEWLRNLIKAGHIADGEVDTRSIINVSPDDIRHFDQCHFFAGIAGWSHALRLAKWPDDRKVWTGSCPCQPFSVAGKGKGTDDERHLWPHFFRLIRGCRPPVVMGEQVAGAAGYGWLDGVRLDLESESYTIEGVDIPACSVNAPHIRQRLYWVANTQSIGRRQGTEDIRGLSEGNREEGATRRFTVNNHSLDMANTNKFGASKKWEQRSREQLWVGQNEGNSNDLNMADPECRGRESRSVPATDKAAVVSPKNNIRSCNFWHDAIWLNGADGKTRRAPGSVKSRFCGLVDGLPSGMDGLRPSIPLLTTEATQRVGKLRALGNAIVPELAAKVIIAFMEWQNENL